MLRSRYCSVLPLLMLFSSGCIHHQQQSDHSKHKSAAVRHQAIQAVKEGLQNSSMPLQLQALAITRKHELHSLRNSVRQLLPSSNTMVAGTSALYLQNSDPKASKIAIGHLSDSDEVVRSFMLQGVVRNLGERAQKHVLIGLQDQSPRVRRVAVSALPQWLDTQSKALLMRVAHSDTSPQVRARALIGLLKVGTDDMDTTISRALSDSYIGARIAGVSLLLKFGSKNSIPTLESLLQSDDPPVALRAAVALRKRNGTDMKWVVLAAMRSNEPGTRAAALNTAAECTDKEGALTIARRGAADKIVALRLTAARLFRRLGHKDEAMQLFREHLNSDKLSDSLMAATELAKEGDKKALQFLSRMSQSGTIANRIATLNAQQSAGVFSDGLLACLNDSDLGLRLTAADALLTD